MTLLEVAFTLVGLFAAIAAIGYAAEGGPAWIMATLVVGLIAAAVPWRVR